MTLSNNPEKYPLHPMTLFLDKWEKGEFAGKTTEGIRLTFEAIGFREVCSGDMTMQGDAPNTYECVDADGEQIRIYVSMEQGGIYAVENKKEIDLQVARLILQATFGSPSSSPFGKPN